MREVEVGEGKALLVYQGGEYMACGHKCTHYGAPLAKGYLGNGRVRCPWHGACFNVKSGDIEDFPGLDGIHSFEVCVALCTHTSPSGLPPSPASDSLSLCMLTCVCVHGLIEHITILYRYVQYLTCDVYMYE